MLHAYINRDGRLAALSEGEQWSKLDEALWVDLVDPSDDERQRIEALYRQPLPDAEDVEEIEASARGYEDQNGLHVHSMFLHEADGKPRNTSVAFTLSDRSLFTLHERDIPVFRLLRMRGRRQPGWAQDPISIVLSLFEIKIEDLADTLEEVHEGLQQVSSLVLEDSDVELEDAIDELARHEDLNGKIRLCLMDTQRALTFLLRRGRMPADHTARAQELLRDIESLLPHNSFLFDKVNFLMDAALGFINIEQNQIIKIFSIAAVVFLPPTLVASIYGMNFRFMPELAWHLGYPLALVLMVASGIAPYVYFKRKGWL